MKQLEKSIKQEKLLEANPAKRSGCCKKTRHKVKEALKLIIKK